MEPGIAQHRRVADVVQPCRRHQQILVLGGDGRAQPVSAGGDGLDVEPPVAVPMQEPERDVPGLGHVHRHERGGIGPAPDEQQESTT
jgi:hypothetical protein